MQPRKTILAMLIGGPLLGVLMGLAADPEMVFAPEPAWRKAWPAPIHAQPQRIVELGPQDLSPTWYLDRMPTWKRRAAEREAAAYALQYADYPNYDPAPPAAAPEPEPEPEPQPAFAAKTVTWPGATPLAAAAGETSHRDAQAAAGAEAVPALTDQAEPMVDEDL